MELERRLDTLLHAVKRELRLMMHLPYYDDRAMALYSNNDPPASAQVKWEAERRFTAVFAGPGL